ncbi:MAG: hypothetical protein HXX13_10850 [Bacteroidetes bacterium]|nr:hypothetical protein [Bacteroidota bacterium]
MKTKTNPWMILLAATSIAIMMAAVSSCTKSDDDNNNKITAGTFTDPRDGRVYKTLTLGNQTWIAENLKYLPAVVGPATGSQTEPCYYVFGYDGTSIDEAKAIANFTTYGVLYNWAAAMSACPAGWHLPDDAEWSQLIVHLGGESVAGGKLKETGTTHWNDPNTGATNETGYTALPGGRRNDDGTFLYSGYNGYWWSSTVFSSGTAWGRWMYYKSNGVSRDACNKEYGFSVICVKN